MDDSKAAAAHHDSVDDDAAALASRLALRVAALEKVVAMQRKLRTMEQRAPRAVPVPDDDSTVLHRSVPLANRVDDDSTVLHRSVPVPRRQDDDSTVLHRSVPVPALSGAPVSGAAQDVPPRSGEQVSLVLAAGTQLAEYRIDAVLGQGGFGVTYLATDVNLNAKVAIKEYLPSDFAQRASDQSVSPRWPDDHATYRAGLEYFLVEARTLATFRHPNIMRVARFFEANRTAYMVLEYERGKSLKQWWPGRKGVYESELLSLLQPLIDGLGVVHASGILHRDIKPDNIYVRRDDGSLVLLDFGAARNGAAKGGIMGDVVTPGYAPPEQYDNGDQGPWTDIYSLGATLYWMVTGAKPPAAPVRAGGMAMQSAREAGMGRYSDPFLDAVDWALALDPRARPQDLHAFSLKLFSAHAGSMALRDALRDEDNDATAAVGGVRILPTTLRSWSRTTRTWPIFSRQTSTSSLICSAPILISSWSSSASWPRWCAPILTCT